MKIRVYVIDFEVPRSLKTWALRSGILLVLVLGGGAVAYASGLVTWSDGDTLRAADLNGNFTYLQSEISSVTGGLPGLGAHVSAPSPFSLPAGPGLGLPNAGQPWIVAGTATSPSTDGNGGLLYVAKTTKYSTPGILVGEQPAMYAYNEVGDGVWGNQSGVLGSIFNANTQDSQPAGTASAVASYGEAICAVSHCSATWGGVMTGYDASGQADPPNALYGLEIDNYAVGTDAHGVRVGLQIAAGRPSGTGAPNSVTHGLLFSAQKGNGQFGNMIDGATSVTTNGIVLSDMTISGVAFNSPGFQIDNVGNVISRSLQLIGNTVATLPACTAQLSGTIAYVTDLVSVPMYNAAIGPGGGSNSTLVLCRNSAWTAH